LQRVQCDSLCLTHSASCCCTTMLTLLYLTSLLALLSTQHYTGMAAAKYAVTDTLGKVPAGSFKVCATGSNYHRIPHYCTSLTYAALHFSERVLSGRALAVSARHCMVLHEVAALELVQRLPVSCTTALCYYYCYDCCCCFAKCTDLQLLTTLHARSLATNRSHRT
jgi:hypothetical protein